MPNYLTGSQNVSGEQSVIDLRTMGKAPRGKMLHDERITKKRLDNPDLWRQLEAISRGTYVNHLGRGHSRSHPPYTENQYIRYQLGGFKPSTLQPTQY
jgi:hypothetical protein